MITSAPDVGNTEDAIINEDLLAVIKNGSINYPQPANISIFAISAQVVYGDSLHFTVSANAQAPFTWTVSDPNLASISSTGYLTVKQSGKVTVKITDANNALATSAIIQLYDTYPKIANSNAVAGMQVEIPVTIKSLPAGLGVLSIEGMILTSNPQLYLLHDIEL